MTAVEGVLAVNEPDAWHAPATYWFWHRLPTDTEIKDQVAQMAAAGYRAFQIQARLSFPRTEYLGPAYLAACRTAADAAAAHEMLIGIYDEYNWLSGHAGGRTVEGRDELRERHLFWATTTGTGGVCDIDEIRPTDVEYLLDPGMNWVFEDARVEWADWEIVAALAHPAQVGDEAGIVDVTASARFTATSATGCAVTADLPPGTGTLTVFVAARCATSRMINYLMPEAAQRFLEVCYEPYRAAFGEHFGTTVAYAFFDQPHGCFFRWRQHEGHLGSSLMYDAALVGDDPEAFRRSLLALVRDVGPATAARRCDFFERYAALGIDAFFGTLSRWCREHGIGLSGHEVLGHVSSWDFTSTIITDDPRTNFGTDYFALDRWRDHTAVDARNSDPQLSAKLGDSVARSHGRSGCLVEQYFGRVVTGSHFAGGRWEVTLRELRSQTIRHHLLGARQLLMHAFWQTDGDEREQMFVNPRFDFAPGLNFEPWFDHHRAFAAESGRLSAFLDGVAPDCAIAVLYPLRTSWACGPSHPYGAHAARWTEHLSRTGHGYHLIDERDLRAAGVGVDGSLVVGDRSYSAVVLPGVEVVRDGVTIGVLERFAAAGGTVLASGPLPAASQQRGADPELTARTAALATAHWTHVPDVAELDPVLAPLRRGHVVVAGDDATATVWSSAGADATGTRLALFHDAAGTQTVTVTPPSLPTRMQRFDAATGAVTDLGVVDGALRLRCGPDELVCLHLGTGERTVPGPTVLTAGWSLTIDGTTRPVRVDRGWEQQGWERFSGVGEYRTAFDLPAGDPGWPDWELELPIVHTTAEVELNGTVIGSLGWAPYVCAVPAGLLRGEGNDLRVRVASTAANHYYAGTALQGDGLDPSGLGAAPVLRPRLGG